MSTLCIRVVIPHFFRERASDNSAGYGSSRRGNRFARSLAFARCLGSVLALNRAPCDWILNHSERQVERTPQSTVAGLPGVLVDLHVFVCGSNFIQEVVDHYAPRLQLHQLDLDDPLQLPLSAVRQLLDFPDPTPLTLYLEDDLVIQDSRYVDKLAWFYDQTDHLRVLMPHRREPTISSAPQHLYVDGPTRPLTQTKKIWASDESDLISVRFWDGQEVNFAEASNPHSGSFCVSSPQMEHLRTAPWPPQHFVGPLETAATGMIRDHFPVLKPTWACREFLTLEHGNPSFLNYLSTLPRREYQS